MKFKTSGEYALYEAIKAAKADIKRMEKELKTMRVIFRNR